MIKKIILTISTTILISGLSSCSGENHDVQYYIDHPDERIKILKKCENDPGKYSESPECKNASQALLKIINQGSEMPRIRR